MGDELFFCNSSYGLPPIFAIRQRYHVLCPMSTLNFRDSVGLHFTKACVYYKRGSCTFNSSTGYTESSLKLKTVDPFVNVINDTKWVHRKLNRKTVLITIRMNLLFTIVSTQTMLHKSLTDSYMANIILEPPNWPENCKTELIAFIH